CFLAGRRVCGRCRHRQRAGTTLLSVRLLWLLRAIPLSAALRVAAGVEPLYLDSRLRFTNRGAREPSRGNRVRRFRLRNASSCEWWPLAPNFRQRVALEFRRVCREFGGFGDFRPSTSQIGTRPVT